MEQERAPGLSVAATRESHRKNDDIKDLVVPNFSAKKAEYVLQPFLAQLSYLKAHSRVKGHTCYPPPPSNMPCLTAILRSLQIRRHHRDDAPTHGLWAWPVAGACGARLRGCQATVDRAKAPQPGLVAEATVGSRPPQLQRWRVLKAAETPPPWSDCRDNVTRRFGEFQLHLGSAQELGLAGIEAVDALGSRWA